MKYLIEYPLEDGTNSVKIEIDESVPETGLVSASKQNQYIKQAKETFEKALDNAKPSIEVVAKKLRSFSVDQPTEVEIEFGLSLSGESGFVFASAGIEATFKIKLVWKKP